MRNSYQVIGLGYADHRRPDPRLAAMIDKALDPARTVLNVGAGAGSYEPVNRRVTAVEPSTVMIEQRPPGAAPVVRACAEALPFRDRSFDAGMAVLTVHHWSDAAAGLAELRRISARQTVVTWDPAAIARFWLVAEYLPQIADAEARLVTLDPIAAHLTRLGAQVTITPMPVPADCTDGFLAAYWRRPRSYLDPRIRAAISSLATLDQRHVERAMDRLAADLDTGRWQDLHRDLLDTGTLDVGYRLITAA